VTRASGKKRTPIKATTRIPPTPTQTTPTPTRIPPTRTQTPKTSASALTGALARCIEPVDAEEFRDRHWEQQPLFVQRNEERRFADLLSVADVERLVCSGGLRFPGFRLVKAGAQIPLSAYASDLPWRPSPFTGTADPGHVAAAFADGATIVLQALHHTWMPLAEFCRGLEVELGHVAQANAYYTPAGSQGFGVHHDTHDVFCLQIAGEKRWRVYEPLLQLPLKNQRYSAELGEHGEPVHDLTLGEGDTLYLPRGWLHEALTSDHDSLHVTVGVNVYTRLDALRAAVESLADDIELRRAVEDDGELPADLLERLRERLEAPQVERRRRDRFVGTRRAVLRGQLAEARALAALNADTRLERRPTVIADLGGMTLSYEGKTISFPEHARAELEAVFAAEGPFRAADLPGDLDEPGRLVLVRRLVREGFLRRSAGGA
jgi:ribosomal protein L16 Arg81 hydroxylase